jgi:hypothetical protein
LKYTFPSALTLNLVVPVETKFASSAAELDEAEEMTKPFPDVEVFLKLTA